MESSGARRVMRGAEAAEQDNFKPKFLDMSDIRKWKKRVGKLGIENYKSPLHEIEYLKDGKILKTVHDGTFSPFEPEDDQYNPAPWLRLRGESREPINGTQTKSSSEPGITPSSSSVVKFSFTGYSVSPSVEYSTDGVHWAQCEMTEMTDGVTYSVSPEFTLEEDEVLYLRSGSTPTDAEVFYFACDGAVYADGNIYAMFSQDPDDWTLLRGISFFAIKDNYCGLTHLPDFPASEPPEEEEPYETRSSSTPYMNYLTNIFLELYEDIVMSDDGKHFNYYNGVTTQMVLEEVGESDETPPFDANLAQELGRANGFFIPGITYFIDENGDPIALSYLDIESNSDWDNGYKLAWYNGEEATFTLTPPTPQDGYMPVLYDTDENEVPLVDGAFTVTGVGSKVNYELSEELMIKTVIVVTSTSENGSYNVWTNLSGVEPIHYVSVAYKDHVGDKQSKVSASKYYMFYKQNESKTVDLQINDSWLPLTFFKSTDGGLTWASVTAIQPKSSQTYQFDLGDGDWLKVVRGGSAPAQEEVK